MTGRPKRATSSSRRSEEVQNDEQPVHAPGIRELPLVALRETVIFPEMNRAAPSGRDKSVPRFNAAMAANGPIALVTQREASARRSRTRRSYSPSEPSRRSPRSCSCRTATVRAIVQARAGFAGSIDFVQTSPYHHRAGRRAADVTPDGIEMQALIRNRPGPDRAVRRQRRAVPPEAAVAAATSASRGLLADMVATARTSPRSSGWQLLEPRTCWSGSKIVSNFLARQIEIPRAEGQDPVRGQVRDGQDPARVHPARAAEGHPARARRGRPAAGEINEACATRVEAAGMPEDVKARALKEVDRNEPDPVGLA